MKWVLILSLIGNAVLGYLLTQKKEVVREEVEVVEKVIVKKAEPTIVEKQVIVEVPKTVEKVIPPVEFDEIEVEDSVEAVNKKREDFLVGKLGFTSKEFERIEEIKRSYIDKYQKIYNPDDGPLTITQRRQMLDLEEERDAEFARAVGPEKWKQWESFRDRYNKKLWKRSMKDQSGVIVPMEI